MGTAEISAGLIYAGIDVSTDTLDIATTDGLHAHLAYNDEGLMALSKHVGAATLVVVEATGGLEYPLVAHLAASGIAVAVVNPRQVRSFADALGIIAKTDAVDASVLARFAEAVRPDVRTLKDVQARELDAFIARRRQLVGLRVVEEQHLARATSASVRQSIETVLLVLRSQITQADKELRRLIESSELWRVRDDLLRSVPGVGPATSAVLIASLPELGAVSPPALASLVGVAPHARESGKWRGARHVWGGRSEVRRALYMAALVGVRRNRVLKGIYEGLLARGKKPKVALVACMRRLLVWLNAIVRSGQPWRESALAGT